MTTRRSLLAAAFSFALISGPWASDAPRFITISSTTSTTDSGLFEHLLPAFERATGIKARVVSQGTGQALDTGRRGDADVVFVHARSQEEKFVADGFGLERRPVMYLSLIHI